ncbi:MAG: LCP family protein [Firmicutes bacterium]|nr:LCP family protein [Bacillota bacterium]MBR0442252.1 LCP family protein [Bacillota bacterium]
MKQRVPKERKKRSLPARIILSVLLFAALAVIITVGAFAGTAYTMVNKISREEPAAEPMTEEEVIAYDQAEIEAQAGDASIAQLPEVHPDEVVFTENAEIKEKEEKEDAPAAPGKCVNILLVGQDRRPGQGRQRSDAVILVTFNKSRKTITMTSIMRDTYVQIPGYKNNRFNAAYAFGGFDLLDRTVEKNFGVKVDGNVSVDFMQFMSIIDTLGGVDITVNDAEAEYLQLPSAGSYHVNGLKALEYAWTRKIDSDFSRTGRQRKLLQAVYNAYRNAGTSELLSLFNDLLPMLTTDMSNSQILGYAADLLPMVRSSALQSQRIPVDGSYKNALVDKKAVLVIDFEKNRRALADVMSE